MVGQELGVASSELAVVTMTLHLLSADESRPFCIVPYVDTIVVIVVVVGAEA